MRHIGFGTPPPTIGRVQVGLHGYCNIMANPLAGDLDPCDTCHAVIAGDDYLDHRSIADGFYNDSLVSCQHGFQFSASRTPFPLKQGTG